MSTPPLPCGELRRCSLVLKHFAGEFDQTLHRPVGFFLRCVRCPGGFLRGVDDRVKAWETLDAPAHVINRSFAFEFQQRSEEDRDKPREFPQPPPRVELSGFACEIDVAARLNAGVLADEFQILEIQDAARHPMMHGHRGWLIGVKSRCQYVEHEVQRADHWHATEVRLADAQRA